MKSKTIAAVAALATTMFLSQGTMAQDQADQANRPADASKQVDQADTSARQAAERAGQRDASGARVGQAQRQGQMDKDQQFVKCATSLNQFEIQAGRIAQRQAQDPEVKRYAQMLVEHHQKAQQQLQQAAGANQGDSQQQQLNPVHQAILQELQKAQGEDFDRGFVYGSVAGHSIAVLMFRDASRECQNEQLKQFAQQTLPTLQKHLQQAQEMAQFDTAQTAGATERAGDRSNDKSIDRRGDRPGTGTDTPGTDRTNRPGAGTNDKGTGSSSDSGTTDRSNPNR